MQAYFQVKFLSVYGAPVYVHWLALLAMAGLLAASFKSPLLGVIFIASYFGMILLHEAGHALFAQKLGYRPVKIQLGLFHGRCWYQGSNNKKHAAIIAWGGVVAQFTVALPLTVLAQTTRLSEVPGFGPLIAFLGYISLMMAFLNLAPSPHLDGGKAWSLLPMVLKEWRDRNKRLR